jgi:hypothetical protein
MLLSTTVHVRDSLRDFDHCAGCVTRVCNSMKVSEWCINLKTVVTGRLQEFLALVLGCDKQCSRIHFKNNSPLDLDASFLGAFRYRSVEY